jgi:hypothetical protein
VLKLRDDLAHNLNHELMLGGDACFNALIYLSQRGGDGIAAEIFGNERA